MNCETIGQLDTYRNVDSVMRKYSEKIKSADELYKVVYFIRKSFSVDSIRLRACFIWVTENINYDMDGYKREDPRSSMLEYGVKNKKAICGGYANLMKFFCDAFNLESEIVSGYARTGKKDVSIGQSNLKANHAWNAVKVNGNWRLIDATWATGSVDETKEDDPKYYKDFKEEYYFTPPDRLIFNHFPEQYKYQFLNKAVPKDKFKKWPLFTTQFISDSIVQIYPDTALIRGKVGDTVCFRIKTNFNPDKICLKTERFDKADYTATVLRNGEWLEFFYPLDVSGNYIIYLGFHDSRYSYPPFVGYKFEVNVAKKN